MTSIHHGCSQRGLVLQPLLRHGFRTAIRVLLSVTKLSLGLLDGSSRGRLVGQTSFLGRRSVANGAVRASMRDEPSLRGSRRTWPPRERSAAGSAAPPPRRPPPPRRLDCRLQQVLDTSTNSSWPPPRIRPGRRPAGKPATRRPAHRVPHLAKA